jgi:hypothetical protein
MATKTKAELEQEIESNRTQIQSLKAELEKANRVETKDNAATELYEMYESYVKAGFTDEQTWKLTKIIINNTTMKRGLL